MPWLEGASSSGCSGWLWRKIIFNGKHPLVSVLRWIKARYRKFAVRNGWGQRHENKQKKQATIPLLSREVPANALRAFSSPGQSYCGLHRIKARYRECASRYGWGQRHGLRAWKILRKTLCSAVNQGMTSLLSWRNQGMTRTFVFQMISHFKTNFLIVGGCKNISGWTKATKFSAHSSPGWTASSWTR